jgi:spectinomycin phosphotransferase
VVLIRARQALALLNHRIGLKNIFMLEKPDIPEQLIISRLQEQYGLHVAELTFLPLGADMGTATYHAATDQGETYFLKLRKGFEEITVTVPLFLKSQGMQEIIAPFETRSKRAWADFNEYKMILYPFIDGTDGFHLALSDRQKRNLGAALKKIHGIQIPLELQKLLPRETLSPYWRERLTAFQAQVAKDKFVESTASKLAEFMNTKRSEIDRLVERVEDLASKLRSKPLQLVLCHSDIHGGNVLISKNDELYIVDWDNPILAPKERDLMFIGGGIDEIWKTEREEAIFYEGYGNTEINKVALAYYRYERVIEDLAVICEQLLLTDEGGADREQAYRWFTSNFEPGQTIEIAEKTDKSI